MHHVLPQTDPQNSCSNNIQGMTCRAPLAGFSGHSSNQIHSSPLFEPKNGAQPLRAHMFPYNSGEEPWDRRDTVVSAVGRACAPRRAVPSENQPAAPIKRWKQSKSRARASARSVVVCWREAQLKQLLPIKRRPCKDSLETRRRQCRGRYIIYATP